MSLEQTELPNGWVWVRIGQLGEIVTGSTPPKKDPVFFGGNIPFYKPTDLDVGYEVVDSREYLSELGASQSRVLPALSVLVTSIGATIGKTGLARKQCATNQQINAIILPEHYISPHWFFWMISSPKGQQMIIENASATTLPIINKSRFSELTLPVPPLNEQHRIVAKIEALKARSQRVKEALEAIPPLLDQFRQSVLAAAFRGDLTADWREKNPDVEPASVLLEQIREKRKNRTEGKSKKSTDFGLPETKIEQLPRIPDSWHWIYFGELITSIRSGSTAVPQDIVSDYPILRSSSVRPGSVDFEDIRYLTKDQSLNEDNFLCEGDVLFTRLSGSLDYVANCAVVRDLKDHCIQYPDRIFRAKLIDTKYSNYSELCFASPLLRTLITGNAKSSAGHQRISMGAITEAPIPLPPLLEQQEIVRRVHSLWKTTNQLETNYQEAEAYIDQLDQSVLAKAFRGELVPQDPNDEPTSVLLERIRAERAKREAEAKIAKKSTGKTTGQRSRKAKQQDLESIQLELLGLE